MADKTSKTHWNTAYNTWKPPEHQRSSFTVIPDENKRLFSPRTLYTSESNDDVNLAPDGFVCYKSDSYLLFPLLRPSLERVWHPLSLILYGETMGSGGRSYYVSRSESGETEGVKAEWKPGERKRERERAWEGERGLRGEITRSQYSQTKKSDETLHEWQFLRPPPLPPLSSTQMQCQRKQQPEIPLHVGNVRKNKRLWENGSWF